MLIASDENKAHNVNMYKGLIHVTSFKARTLQTGTDYTRKKAIYFSLWAVGIRCLRIAGWSWITVFCHKSKVRISADESITKQHIGPIKCSTK